MSLHCGTINTGISVVIIITGIIIRVVVPARGRLGVVIIIIDISAGIALLILF
jgi:hypothetical protein